MLRLARRAAVGVTVGLLVITGCGSGPNQLGAAAIVGQTVIPVERVQSQLDAALARLDREQRAQLVQSRHLDDISRNIVTLAVRHELLVEAARRERISIDEEQVTKLINALGGVEQASRGTVISPAGFRARVRDQLIAVELGRRALDGLAVTVDYTTVTSRNDAFALARRLAEHPERARELIRAQKDAGADAMLNARLVAAENPELAAAPVFGVPKGTVVAFPVDRSASQWLVAVVRSRTENAAAANTGTAAVEPDPEVLEQVGIRQLVPLAADLGVRVNPRYGIWDPMSLAVVPNENELGGLVLPVPQSAP